MIDLLITLCVAAFFGAAWAAGRYLPKAVAASFPIAAFGIVVALRVGTGVAGARDWLMMGLVICITLIVTLSGRAARRRAACETDQSASSRLRGGP